MRQSGRGGECVCVGQTVLGLDGCRGEHPFAVGCLDVELGIEVTNRLVGRLGPAQR